MLEDRHRPLIEAGQLPNPANIELPLLKAQQGVDVAARHQASCYHVGGNIETGETAQDLVEEIARHALEPAALALHLYSVDDIAAFAGHFGCEGGEPFRLFLEIAVDQKDLVAASVRQSGHHRLV